MAASWQQDLLAALETNPPSPIGQIPVLPWEKYMFSIYRIFFDSIKRNHPSPRRQMYYKGGKYLFLVAKYVLHSGPGSKNSWLHLKQILLCQEDKSPLECFLATETKARPNKKKIANCVKRVNKL